MLFKPEYDENGKKILCEMNGINSEMLMDIYVKKMKKGEVLEICEDKNECGECYRKRGQRSARSNDR